MENTADFVISSVTGLAFVLATIAIVLASYFLARRLLHPGNEGDRTLEVAGNVAVRVATLHSLILGLVYAQELDDYKGVRATLIEETIAISDVFNDVRRYGGAIVTPVQAGLSRYVFVVVNEEWESLADGKGLSPKAWQEWERVYDHVLDLVPTTDRQRYLSTRLKDRVTAIAKYRQLREAPTTSRFSGLFWGPAIIGLIIISSAFYVYRPSRTHLVLFGLFGAYSGVILFFIFAFGNPYANPGKLEPRPFQRLLEGDLGNPVLTTPDRLATE
ncbi:DUF4239 domain-containing protein [Rhizobium sp. Leaf383]|uniref:bestrophin-like domain n=1 Tax=Rhizobium sp. Leaf383 TaxID=1736357 RepID=UPI0007128A6D|nr:DUF4239 domain-containing protein [Rhizobium sp. Leaf383]KQS74514.1 hypothetical protein ASG58_16245 [Rhizobium sp. Leaf383]